MARLQRQREPLESGFTREEVIVGPANTRQTVVLQVPGIGSPMDLSGTLRNAPSQWLSLYAAIRPTAEFNPFDVAGVVHTLFEVGVVPYNDRQAARPTGRHSRPMYSPFTEPIDLDPMTFENVLARRTLLPWPPGSLSVRVSFDWSQVNNIGDVVDVCVAWAVSSIPAYNSLPAIEDTVDL